MRVILSLGALVTILWLVIRLTGGQGAALTTAPSSSGGAASGSLVEQTAASVQKSIEQGAAQRADDAASR